MNTYIKKAHKPRIPLAGLTITHSITIPEIPAIIEIIAASVAESLPVGIGLVRVRFINASHLFSQTWFMPLLPPVRRKPPTHNAVIIFQSMLLLPIK